jgi:putative tricarboxylic transport membrane protein
MVVKYLVAMLCVSVAAAAGAQSWSPQKNVELVVPNPPGGSNDKTARTVERIWTANKLLSSTLTVINKSGGGGSIAYTYIQQHAGDPHYLGVAGPALLTNHITGASKLHHTDLTAVASLFNDYTAFAVSADSPIKSGKDLVDRLRKDPKSVTIGFSPCWAATTISPRGYDESDRRRSAELRWSRKGSADAIPNHERPHRSRRASGNVAHRRLRQAACHRRHREQRLPGAMAAVPTWKEQGVDHVFGAWRAIFAPKGLTPPQVAYWEGTLRKATEAPEWKADLEKNLWSDDFTTGDAFRKELDKDYAGMKAVLVDIGLAK